MTFNIDGALTKERLEDAERRLLEACNEINDLNVQCKFWRQAAEHAVDGWNKLEDEYEGLLEKIDTLASDARDEWAPPAPVGFDPFAGVTIIETEKKRR